jgi:hypothetical protein
MIESDVADQPTCFVAMPVTTPNNYAEKLGDANHFRHVLDHLFTPALNNAGYRVIAPTSRGAQLIHAEIIKNLEQTNLVLCDLSSLNANVFFELGIRTSLDRPVVLVKDRTTERIPFDLNAINTHTYDESLAAWTLTDEINQLTEHIKAVDTSTGSGNNMWHYFGLTKRATPAEVTGNPTAAKLDLLLAEVTALKAQGAQREDSIQVMRDYSSPRERSTSNIRNWIRQMLAYPRDQAGDVDIYRTGDGYRIVLDEPLTDDDRKFLQAEAKARFGEGIIIEQR